MNRIIYASILALVTTTALDRDASAGPLSTPGVPIAHNYLAITDVEMTVSNPYGFANLRQYPTTSSKIIERLLEGTKVTVIETVAGGTWAHVKVNGKDGYIKAKLLK